MLLQHNRLIYNSITINLNEIYLTKYLKFMEDTAAPCHRKWPHTKVHVLSQNVNENLLFK